MKLAKKPTEFREITQNNGHYAVQGHSRRSPMNIRINFTSPETRGIVLPDAENRTIVSSFVCTQYRNVTDRQRDERNPSS